MDAPVKSPEQPAAPLLGESEARLNFALAAGRLGYWEFDLKTTRLLASDIYKANWGLSPSAEFSYDTLLAAIHPDDRDMHEQAVAKSIATCGPLDIEYRNIWPDGSVHWVRVRGHAVYSENGEPAHMAGISLDITDSKRTEESLREQIEERRRVEKHQELLLAELNHRVKNTLAIVLSIATQTLRHTDTAEAFRSGFEARIMALAEAHNLLTDGNWQGASLRAILERVLGPYRGEGEPRYILADVKDVRLGPKTAVALLMAVNELATNAVKYGALSTPDGRVIVAWTAAGGAESRLQMRWQESGGPAVANPSRHGFGTRLIRGLSEDAGGKVTMDFASRGLQCTFDLPLSAGAAA